MDALDDLLAKDANTLTTLEWAVILHVNKEKAELAAAELARLQAIEAAARDTLNDIKDNWYIENLQPGGVAESDVSVDHILALAAALSASPQPPQPGDGDGAG
jgi:hypothetical protein